MHTDQPMSQTTSKPLQLGLTGYPLGHSLSPALHRAALSACGLSGDYQLYPIPPLPEGSEALGSLLVQVRAGAIHGLNVTIPHKQSMLEHLDELSSPAKAIGAVNTIYAVRERLVGDNTDAHGFITDLSGHLDQSWGAQSALVLGAGGSARAVVYALLEGGWHVVVAARRISQARQLVEIFQSQSAGGSITARLRAVEMRQITSSDAWPLFSILDSPHPLIVNTTPVGMAPHSDACPWPEDLPFPPGAFVYDLVYNPPKTKLMRLARSQSVPAANGLGMLVEQAALAFEIWTGYPAPRAVMHAAVSDQNEQT